MRLLLSLCLASAAFCLPLSAQIAEPMLTARAIPFAPGTGGLKLDYAGPIHSSTGGAQIIPEATLETGVSRNLEALARFPLLRVTPPSGGPALIAGGQLAVGARYLVAGGRESPFAIAGQVIAEAPTGDGHLEKVTQVVPGMLADWRPASSIVVHTNLSFDHSIGGGDRAKQAFLEYSQAVVWLASAHVVPALEFAGSTNTYTTRTQLVEEPEVILRLGSHLEGKAGLMFGLNPQTTRLSLRAQIECFWGRRR